MFERKIFTVLTDGLSELIADPVRIEEFFVRRGLDREEAINVRAYFEAKAPTIIHGYPREDTTIPLWSIILSSQSESNRILNDVSRPITLGEAETAGDTGLTDRLLVVTHVRSDFSILVIANSADEAIYQYELMRYIILRARPTLKAQGALLTSFAGSDLSPRLQYLPTYVFARQFNFQVTEQLALDGAVVTRPSQVETTVTVSATATLSE